MRKCTGFSIGESTRTAQSARLPTHSSRGHGRAGSREPELLHHQAHAPRRATASASALDDVDREPAARAVSLYLLLMSAPVCRMVAMTLSSETLWGAVARERQV